MSLVIKVIAIYMAVMSIVAFAAYGIDKVKAKKNLWRIPEKVLILLAFIGGSLGALIGMYVFHHKTKKLKFTVLVPLALIIHIALIILIATQV